MGIISSENAGLKLPEGSFIVKWIYNRMVVKNKNIIIAVTGSTGSGKSYLSTRIYELWCKRMNFEPSVVYICFSIQEIMKLLTSPDLKRYSLIVLEEAGTSLGNLDFQNRVSKLFTYVLQSFRSMNIGLIMNLPVFTMLNKSARQLVHAHIITTKIDFEKNEVKTKCYFHQLNQASGKSYWKCPRVKINGRARKLSYLNFGLPSQELIQRYELKKQQFVIGLANDFMNELNKLEKKKVEENTIKRKPLTKRQREVMKVLSNVKENNKYETASRILGIAISAVHQNKKLAEKKGYTLEEFKENVK